MSLKLYPTHLQAMQAHAERSYPNECCGLLLGTLKPSHSAILGREEPSATVLVEVKTLDNTWDAQVAREFQDDPASTAAHRYWIAPEVLLAVMREARCRNLDVIGIYHSHPDHAAVPSECDRRLAWPQYTYLILSVIQGKATDIQSWQLDENHQFQRDSIILAASHSL